MGPPPIAAALLAATPSPLPLAYRRWTPLLAAPPPALRSSRNPAASPQSSRSRHQSRARGRGEATEEPGQASGVWSALAGRLALPALLGSATLLGCRGGRGLHQASGFGLRVAEPRLARRRRRVHTGHIAGARAEGSDSGRVLDAPSPRPADRPGSFGNLISTLCFSGNMVPVPFIIIYLKKLATFLSQRSAWATRVMDLLFERALWKAAPVVEFQWLGLMLFVAVPFPGTEEALTGAIIASVLGMPF